MSKFIEDLSAYLTRFEREYPQKLIHPEVKPFIEELRFVINNDVLTDDLKWELIKSIYHRLPWLIEIWHPLWSLMLSIKKLLDQYPEITIVKQELKVERSKSQQLELELIKCKTELAELNQATMIEAIIAKYEKEIAVLKQKLEAKNISTHSLYEHQIEQSKKTLELENSLSKRKAYFTQHLQTMQFLPGLTLELKETVKDLHETINELTQEIEEYQDLTQQLELMLNQSKEAARKEIAQQDGMIHHLKRTLDHSDVQIELQEKIIHALDAHFIKSKHHLGATLFSEEKYLNDLRSTLNTHTTHAIELRKLLEEKYQRASQNQARFFTPSLASTSELGYLNSNHEQSSRPPHFGDNNQQTDVYLVQSLRFLNK